MTQCFKLLVGKHIGEDLTQPPVSKFNDATGDVEPVIEVDRRNGQQRYRYPSKIYSQGEVVESDIDLETRFGAEKFQRLERPARNRRSAPKGAKPVDLVEDAPNTMGLTAPGGQVITGHPSTVAGVPGPLSPKKVAEIESLTADQDEVQSGLKERSPRHVKRFKRSELHGKTVREIKELAHENEIDLEGETTKDAMIAKFDPSDD